MREIKMKKSISLMLIILMVTSVLMSCSENKMGQLSSMSTTEIVDALAESGTIITVIGNTTDDKFMFTDGYTQKVSFVYATH